MYGAAADKNEEVLPMPEKNDRIVSEDSSVEVRHKFLRGVLLIVSVQLAVTTFLSAAVMWIAKPWDLLFKSPLIFWSSFIFTFVVAGGVYLSWLRNADLFRKSPTKYIMLAIFTLCMAVPVGYLSPFFMHILIMLMIFFTIGSFALTLFVCQTSYDFKTCSPYLLSLVVMVLSVLVYGAVVPLLVPLGLEVTSAYDMWRICVGAFLGFLCCCDMIFTSQGVMLGQSYKFEVDEYCSAAIMIFVECQDPCFMPLMLCGNRE